MLTKLRGNCIRGVSFFLHGCLDGFGGCNGWSVGMMFFVSVQEEKAMGNGNGLSLTTLMGMMRVVRVHDVLWLTSCLVGFGFFFAALCVCVCVCVCVCGGGSISSSVLGCLMYLSPVGLWLSISIVHWKRSRRT